MIFWTISLTWFFAVTAVSLVSLLIIDHYVTGQARLVTRLLIHVLSVAFFIGFLWYLSTTLMRSCSQEVTQTVVIALILFVLLLVGLFYYIGRKRI